MTPNSQLVTSPFFLVGAERSGTTLLRLMLSSHPQIAWCNEFEYAVDQIEEMGEFPPLNQYYEWLETHRIFQATKFKINPQLNYCELANSFLEQKRSEQGKPIVGATVHRHFNRLLFIWPDARFIHLIRDARDVARSCIQMGWAGNVWTGVSRWQEAEQLWDQLKAQIPPERILEVSYEKLITEPVPTLTNICQFIGVPFNEEMLTYSQKTTYDSPDPKLIQQWRKKLSEQEIRLIESRVGKILEEKGYQLSGLPPLTLTPTMERQLKIQDWWERLQFRIKRFGLPLVIADNLSRKLGFKEWQKEVRLKLNTIETSYLK